MLATNTACSGISVLSTNISRKSDLTTAHQNLAGKESEALMIDSVWVVTQVGSEPCSTIWLATYRKSEV